MVHKTKRYPTSIANGLASAYLAIVNLPEPFGRPLDFFKISGTASTTFIFCPVKGRNTNTAGDCSHKAVCHNSIQQQLSMALTHRQSPCVLVVSTHFTRELFSCIVTSNGGITHPSMRLSRPSRINVVNHVVLK